MKFKFPKIHIEIERWKYCQALDIYVSNLGRLKDKDGNIQKVCASNNYLHWKGKLVHRIVMQTWNPVSGYAFLTVDHLDHNTRNNKLSNLEWVTDEENKARNRMDATENAPAITSETHIKAKSPTGEKLFLVNKMTMTFEAAKELLRKDKTLSGTANIERAFKKAMNKNDAVKFGNYTIQYVRTK